MSHLSTTPCCCPTCGRPYAVPPAVPPAELRVGDLVLDCARWTLRGPCGAEPISGQQHTVLAALMREPAAVVRTDSLIGALYPDPDREPEYVGEVLRTVVFALRHKLRRVAGDGVRITTRRRVGYMIEEAR